MSNQIPLFELTLFEKLNNHEPTASSELYQYVVKEKKILALYENLYKDLDKEDIWTIVTDSILNLTEVPNKYIPEKGTSLINFIKMDIEGDLKNLRDKQIRNKNKFIDVELSESNGNRDIDYDTPEIKIVHKEITNRLTEAVNSIFGNELDRHLAWLILDEERKTEVFAKILNLEQLPKLEQEREVKRHKDRIKKRLERSNISIILCLSYCIYLVKREERKDKDL